MSFESLEQPQKFKVEEVKSKIDTILAGTMIGEMMIDMDFMLDVDGNLADHVVKNLKTMATVGARMTPEPEVKRRLENFLKYLEAGNDR